MGWRRFIGKFSRSFFWEEQSVKMEQDLLSDIKRTFADPSERNIFVTILDCGGQHSFSVVQALAFNASESIFFLVYDLTIPFDAKLHDVFRDGSRRFPILSLGLSHGDYLALWLSTLSMAIDPCIGREGAKPLVIPIGTHRADVDSTLLKKSDEAAKRMIARFKNAPLRFVEPIHIDNKCPTSDDMVFLRRVVSRHVKREAALKPFPLSFLKAEWMIKRSTLSPHMSVRTFCQLPQLAQAAGIPKRQMKTLLDSLHQHGVVRSFYHNQMPEAEALVFMKAEWLLEKVSRLLALSMKTADFDTTYPTISDRDHINVYLRKMGILTTYVCEKFLWSDLSPQVRTSILKIMYDVGLQCPVTGGRFGIPEDAGQLYHVPMCIQEDTTLDSRQRSRIDMPAILMAFSNQLLPHALFSRFAVHMLQHYRPHEPDIGFRSVRLCCDNDSYCYFAELHYLSQGVAIRLGCADASVAVGSIHPTRTPDMAVMAKNLLCTAEEIFKKLQHTGSPGLKWFPAFECPQHPSKSNCNMQD